MKSNHLIVKKEGNIFSIMLNRPEVLNAFTLDMKEGLLNAFREAKKDKQIGAIVLHGAGRSFCAGGDVKKMGESTALSTYEHMCISKELIITMTQLDIPIITVVHGYAAGGGAGLVLASDIIFAAEDSKIYFSFSKIGLIPDTGSMFFLPRTLGLYRAKEVIFNPKPIEANKAYDWGLVNYIYSSDQVLTKAKEYAQELAEGPKRAIGHMKELANRALLNDLRDILEMENSIQSVLITTNEHKEGVKAFQKRRRPNFKAN